jgi:transposase-like protein
MRSKLVSRMSPGAMRVRAAIMREIRARLQALEAVYVDNSTSNAAWEVAGHKRALRSIREAVEAIR